MMKIRYQAFILGLLIGGFIACCSCSKPLPKGPTSISIKIDKKFSLIGVETSLSAVEEAAKKYNFKIRFTTIEKYRRAYIFIKNNHEAGIYIFDREEDKTLIGLYAENYDRDYDDILLLVANELKK